MALYLAMDVGGTKTDYVLADETRTLARVRTGTIKRLRTDAATATANLDQALQELCARTSISMQSVTRTCIGAAGETVPLVADWLRSSVSIRVSGELILIGDVEIALDAAFQGKTGILVLAGTGSNVAGRTIDGSVSTVGGWGPALADQGSGHRIGEQALRAAFLAVDEGRTSPLMDAILHFWKLTTIEALIEFANSSPSPDFSRLTELVFRMATQGDRVAAAVLRREGEDLGYLVCLMMRRLLAAGGSVQDLPSIAFAGSIMENVPPVRDALLSAVRMEFPSVQTREGVVDPIDGALWRARTGGAH